MSPWQSGGFFRALMADYLSWGVGRRMGGGGPLVRSCRCPHVLSGPVCGHEQPLGTQEAGSSSVFPASSEDIFGTTALEVLFLWKHSPCFTFTVSCLPCSRLRQLSQNEERSAFRLEWLSLPVRAAGQGTAGEVASPGAWMASFQVLPLELTCLSLCLCPEQHQALRWNWHIPTTTRILMCVRIFLNTRDLWIPPWITTESRSLTYPKIESVSIHTQSWTPWQVLFINFRWTQEAGRGPRVLWAFSVRHHLSGPTGEPGLELWLTGVQPGCPGYCDRLTPSCAVTRPGRHSHTTQKEGAAAGSGESAPQWKKPSQQAEWKNELGAVTGPLKRRFKRPSLSIPSAL